jgi:DUF4097 and DUF4098 domain-containing protein YvlB
MKLDPAAKDLTFTSVATCPDVTVSGTQNTDGFVINIAYPQMNGFNNNLPRSCVSVNVTVPPTYAFDPAFQLNTNLMAISSNIDLGNAALSSIHLSALSGNVYVSNIKMSGPFTIATSSGNLKASGLGGLFSKATLTTLSGNLGLDSLSCNGTTTDLRVSTSSGNLVATGIKASGSIMISTLSGDLISSDISGAISSAKIITSSGNLKVKSMQVLKAVTLSTLSGDLTAEGLSGPISDAKISSSSGSINIIGFGTSSPNAIIDIHSLSGDLNADFVILRTFIF